MRKRLLTMMPITVNGHEGVIYIIEYDIEVGSKKHI